MKKIIIYTAAFILACIALANIVPLAGLLISGILVMAGIHFYDRDSSTATKIFSWSLLLIGGFSALSNFSAFVGLFAIVALYYLFKQREHIATKKEDPFENFEKEWAKLQK